jgi:hypothetical protein
MGQSICARENANERQESGAIVPTRNTRRKLGSGSASASAFEVVQSILDRRRQHARNVHHLMTHRLTIGAHKSCTTTAATLGPHFIDRADAVGWQHLSLVPRVTRLSTPPSSASSSPRPLWRSRRITRRRPRRIAGVLPELSLQILDPRRLRQNLRRQRLDQRQRFLKRGRLPSLHTAINTRTATISSFANA